MNASPARRALSESLITPRWGMTTQDRRRVIEWLQDAFSILCVRIGSRSRTETKLRLTFEALLREVGSSPLRLLSEAPPPLHARAPVGISDLRQILRALGACAQIFSRYSAVLTPEQRQLDLLVQAALGFAEDELRTRTTAASPADLDATSSTPALA